MTYSKEADQEKFPFILKDLPFSKNDFGDLMSPETFDYHYSKHHQAYVTNLNKLLEEQNIFKDKTLEDIIITTHSNESFTGIFNNAAQVWNHSFFWHSLSPNPNSLPSPKLQDMINQSFDNIDNFNAEFIKNGVAQFGSGWVWLVQDGTKLKIVKASNAHTPITQGLNPLICCDVWEHAYYIDHRNARPNFLKLFVENLINWDFADKNLK
ncbi:MAG: superoxide dismutase [Rickettsiaceae bacterium]|nr:superoxide dismutase [Rickettsiaceae bacterium]